MGEKAEILRWNSRADKDHQKTNTRKGTVMWKLSAGEREVTREDERAQHPGGTAIKIDAHKGSVKCNAGFCIRHCWLVLQAMLAMID